MSAVEDLGRVEDAVAGTERGRLLAEAIRALTAAARLTRPVLERDEQASQAEATPVYRDTGRREPDDWAEFVSQALAAAAANAGGVETALAGRPGSWEADFVRQLLTGTVGHASEYLWEHRTEPVAITLYVDEILWDLEPSVGMIYQDAVSELSQRPIAAPEGTDEYDQAVDELGALEDRLEEQRQADWTAYGQALADAVRAAAARRPGLTVPIEVTVDVDTFRPGDQRDEPYWPTLEWELVGEAMPATPVPGDGRTPLQRLQPADEADR